MKKDFTQKDERAISFLLTIMVSVGYINFLVSELFDMGGMIVNIGIIITVMVFSYKTILKIKFPAVVLAFVLMVLLNYTITYETQGTTLFGREIIYYFCFATVLAMYKCDTEALLRYLSYASMLILPFYNDIFIEMTSTLYNDSISMGMSYSMFPLLMAGVFHFIYFRSKAGVVQYVIYAISIFLLFQLVMKGTRGIMFSILFAVVIVFLKGGFNRRALEKKKGPSTARIIVAVILLLCLYVWFYEIMKLLQIVLTRVGIDAHFIDKIFSLYDAGDVLNGRQSIYEYTVEHIFEDLFFGHGLSTIFVNSRYRIIYSHNFLLQLLYDGGLFLTIPVLFVVGKALYCVFTEDDENEAAFTLFFMSISLPAALFSGDVWKNQIFWIFVMHSMKYLVIKRKTGFEEGLMPVLKSESISQPKGEEC